MADKKFNRWKFQKINFKTFKDLSSKSKKGIINFYDCVLGACKKYNPMRYYERNKDRNKEI